MRFLTIQETPNDQVMRAEVLQAELGVTHCVVGGEDSDVGGAREGVGVFGQLRDIREAGLDVLCAPPDGAQRAVLEVKTRLHRLHKKSPQILDCQTVLCLTVWLFWVTMDQDLPFHVFQRHSTLHLPSCSTCMGCSLCTAPG